MAKVVVASLRSKAKKTREFNAVIETRVRGATGQFKTLRTLDARSVTFGDDLKYVFSKNVAKARRDNKRTVGANDVAIAKR